MKIIITDENGATRECHFADFVRDNDPEDDEDWSDLRAALEQGKTVRLGGGAQPIFDLRRKD